MRRTLHVWLFLAWAEASLTDAQRRNQAPVFLPGGDMDSFAIREDTPIGTRVYTLKAEDPDGTDLLYTVSGDFLSVDQVTGVVTLVKTLDREVISSFEVVITATDEAVFGEDRITTALRRVVGVEDVNDNSPIFHDAPYYFEVLESASPGDTLFTGVVVSDADVGPNGKVRLSCIKEYSPEVCRLFAVREVQKVNREYVGVISLNSQLDYERDTQYIIALRAEDFGNPRRSATSVVEIVVKDVQDQPPVFMNAPYTATVEEGIEEGISILNVSVRDGDIGQPRSIRLSLVGDESGYFELRDVKQLSDGTVTASVTTSAIQIDREATHVLHNGGLYSFRIKATEVGSGDTTEAQVAVVVTDRDDQKPEFNHESVSIVIPEDIHENIPLPDLDLVVSDGDAGDNARFSLSLEDLSNSTGVFSIYPETVYGRSPVIIKVVNSSRVDFEDPAMSSFVFKVVASHEGQALSHAVVNVTIVDANDNSPEFEVSSQRFDVRENSVPGTQIARLTATDRDTGLFGEINYSLKGFGAKNFEVDSSKGIISVASCANPRCLDYEEQQSYSLTYSGTDGGDRDSSINIFIDIIDENDEEPVFSQSVYKRTADDGDTTFDPPFFVKATDADGVSQGAGRVSYSIVGSNTDVETFFVDSVSGEIIIQNPLSYADTISSTYEITVMATDAGNPTRSSNATVIVILGRNTNRPPRFLNRTYSAAVSEDAKPGTSVLRVTAFDLDSSNTSLSYHISSGSKDSFVIDESTGEISVASGALIDRDGESEFKMVVVAVDDDGETRESGSATVVIDVQDVNNKPPNFEQEFYIEYIDERLALGDTVLFVKASDPDEDADLFYKISQPILSRDRTGVASGTVSAYNYTAAFRINATTGEITVAGPLDHNKAAVIILPIEVQDLNAAREASVRQSDRTEVTVYVQAYTGKDPLFQGAARGPRHPVLEEYLKEERAIGSSVFTIKAKDPVTSQPVRRFEKVGGSDPEDIFNISPITGEVSLKKRLDYEASKSKTKSFQVLAIVRDRSSQATVTVHIEDINDNSPQFTENEYHTRLSESAAWRKSVLTVTAEDADTGDFGRVTYDLGGEGATFFTINRTTGEIQVAEGSKLDRETTPTITLEVTASDMPQGGLDQRKTTVIVKVDLIDVNDEAPMWSEKMYTIVVAENTPVGTPVSNNLLAKDPDQGINGLVRYEIPPMQGEIEGLFEIDPESGILSVKSALSGKGRTEPYELRVAALDRGEPRQASQTTIRLYVGDVSTNDGVPVFVKPEPNEVARIRENGILGSAVFQVKATDPDDPETSNGRINYSFLDEGEDNGVFAIDPSSGLITTIASLDREARGQYTLVVVAQDLGRPPQLASRVLLIDILDADDNDPVFQKLLGEELVEMEVEEEVDVGTVVGYITAIDEDITDNANIDYAISYGNTRNLFAINRTDDNRGLIYVNRRIDRENVESVTLTVVCGKLGVKLPSSLPYDWKNPSMVQVKIYILDIDDNPPYFLQEGEASTGVRVDAPVQTEVLRFRAVDLDPTSPPIKYDIFNISFEVVESRFRRREQEDVEASEAFLLEPSSGLLRTNAPMAKYSHGIFVAFISATSNDKNDAVYKKATIYILRDSELLKFVFDTNPGEVQRKIASFSREVNEAIPVTSPLEILATDYYIDSDGAIDFSRTGSCFQLVGQSLRETKILLDRDQNENLTDIYERYKVKKIERCVPYKATLAGADWIEVWVLAIAAFIGIAATSATCVLCCLYARYKRQVRRQRRHLRLLESPHLAIIGPPVLAPGSVAMIPQTPTPPYGPPNMPPSIISPSEQPDAYEWQERALPLDNISYRSLND